MAAQRPNRNDLPANVRQRLNEAHAGLLHVHKALIDHERIRYERQRGRIPGPGDFLQLLIHDPWFAWLRPISELAALIDETVSTRDPVDSGLPDALLKQARELLVASEIGDDFQRAYHRAIQESPEVLTAHADWKLLTGRQ